MNGVHTDGLPWNGVAVMTPINPSANEILKSRQHLQVVFHKLKAFAATLELGIWNFELCGKL